MTIAGKAVLVTGANRGIGRALVNEALGRGAGRVYAGTRQLFTHADARVTPLILDVIHRAWNVVFRRAAAVDLPKRAAFISPLVEPVAGTSNKISDAQLRYTLDFADVMLTYSRKSFGYLPPK